VVAGSWDSWDQGKAVEGAGAANGYTSYTWSPCGQFVAAHAEEFVEIWDRLTLELLSTLALPDGSFIGGPIYSPDGRSLASLSNVSLVIWDIQTGGVTKEIEHSTTKNALLVWSLDGGTIGTIFHDEDSKLWTVHTCDIASGTTLSSITLQSTDKPHLWAHNTSFRVMTTGRCGRAPIISIFEVGSILTKVESFWLNFWRTTNWIKPTYQIKSFSPATYHISIDMGDSFAILDIRSSECLLEQAVGLNYDCFSSNGSLFAACGDHIHVWKYISGQYTLQREFLTEKPPYNNTYPLHFSPTSASILRGFPSTETLQVWHLDGPPILTAPLNCPTLFAAPHCCATYMVTCHKGGSTVTITNLLSQTPPHLINTDMKIEDLILTGNVLLVLDSTTISAWQLTEEGTLDGNKRARYGGRIWTIPQSGYLELSVEDQAVFIKDEETIIHTYHTETGEVLKLAQTLPDCWEFHNLCDVGHGEHHPHCHQGNEHNPHSEDNWPHLEEAVWQGWIMDPEGKHQLWIPVKWRSPDDDSMGWLHNVKTLWFTVQDEPIIIKF
jgi:hypothetical protein